MGWNNQYINETQFFFGDRTSQKKHHTHKGMKLIFRLQVFSGIDHIIQETQQPSDGVVAGAANVQGEPCTQVAP